MKKLFFIFFSVLTLAASCVRELDIQSPDPAGIQLDSTVTITFGVQAPESTHTKAMADQPQIDCLFVAVFGGSGYLKEYVKAEPVELADHQRDSLTDPNHLYAYTVKLSLTKSKIRVHFIANGPGELPFDYESTVIGQLTTTGGEDAYWQKVILPNGIYALDDEGSQASPPVYTVDPDFDLDDDGNHIMACVPLVRNFAKIAVESQATNLTVKSFAVVNVPSAGTVAAYNTNTGEFIMDYADHDFASLSAAYPGNMPSGTTIEKIIPTQEDFENGTNGVALASASDSNVYMYERPVPESNASFLLLYATYTDDNYPDGVDCYYKIDLMSDGAYLPIYRNFRYKIVIKSVYRVGKDNPTSAANGAGSGDISSDVETASLENVSDGVASIAVSYTEQTFTDQGTYSVKYRYVPNISDGTVQNGEDYVSFELLSAGSTGNSIVESSLTRADADDTDTYRELFFTTTEVGSSQKTQKIRITGTSTTNGRTSRLYREVTIRLMPKQTMTLSCSPSSVNQAIGEAVDLYINIPLDLPASIFPLQFQIESSALSITPNNDNLPVESGASIIESNNGKPSFQFIKTLSRADYLAYQEEAENSGAAQVSVPCHFKTNTAVSASDIYVANTYFNTASTSFTNFIERYFTQLGFSTMTAAEDEAVEFYFMMDEAHESAEKEFPEYVYVTLYGLIPSESSPNLSNTSNPYVYAVSSNIDAASALQTLYLQSTGETANYSVKLTATNYAPDSLVAHRALFADLAFSNTPYYGNGWSTDFSFSIPSDYEMPSGGIDILLDLTNLTIDTTDTNLWQDAQGNFYYHASSTGAHSFSLLTADDRTADVSVTLSHSDFEDASESSGRSYITIASRGMALYSSTYGLFDGITIYLYSDKSLSNQLLSFDASRSGNYAGYNTNDVSFDGTVLDADSKLYFNYTESGWWSTTQYYASTNAATMVNGDTITFSTNAPGVHVVRIDTNGNYFSTSDLSETSDSATVTFASGSIYSVSTNNGGYVRLNTGSQNFTVSAEGTITSITFTVSGNNYRPTTQTASPGSITRSNNTYTWTDSSNASPSEVVFTLTKNGQMRITNITITYEEN